MTVTIKRCGECENCNPTTAERCEECGSTQLTECEACSDLECNHCGDVAVESPTGMFHEDMADKCVSCGFPGHVSVYDGTATWVVEDDDWNARCTQPLCQDRHEYDREDLKRAVAMLHRAVPILELEASLDPCNDTMRARAEEAHRLMADIVARWGRGEDPKAAQKPAPKS